MKANEIKKAIQVVADQRGAKVQFTTSGSSHNRATLIVGDKSRYITFPCSPSHPSSLQKTVSDARRVLRGMEGK